MGWLIDPEEQSLLIHSTAQPPDFLQAEQAVIPVPHFASDLQLTVGDLFSWLRL